LRTSLGRAPDADRADSGGGHYRVRPIHLDEYAELVTGAVVSKETYTRDACGPNRVEFGVLIREIAVLTGGQGRPMRLPLRACVPLYAAASRVMHETILTPDEPAGLSRNRLDSLEAPSGRTGLLACLREHASEIGHRFAREPHRQSDGMAAKKAHPR